MKRIKIICRIKKIRMNKKDQIKCKIFKSKLKILRRIIKMSVLKKEWKQIEMSNIKPLRDGN